MPFLRSCHRIVAGGEPMIEFRWRKTTVPRFHSAVIACFMFVCAVVELVMVFHKTPRVLPWGATLLLLVLCGALYQLWRIHRVFQTTGTLDESTNQVLIELVRTYQWGSITFFVLATIVIMVHASR